MIHKRLAMRVRHKRHGYGAMQEHIPFLSAGCDDLNIKVSGLRKHWREFVLWNFPGRVIPASDNSLFGPNSTGASYLKSRLMTWDIYPAVHILGVAENAGRHHPALIGAAHASVRASRATS